LAESYIQSSQGLYFRCATAKASVTRGKASVTHGAPMGYITEGISNHAVSILRTARGVNKWREAPCVTTPLY